MKKIHAQIPPCTRVFPEKANHFACLNRSFLLYSLELFLLRQVGCWYYYLECKIVIYWCVDGQKGVKYSMWDYSQHVPPSQPRHHKVYHIKFYSTAKTSERFP